MALPGGTREEVASSRVLEKAFLRMGFPVASVNEGYLWPLSIVTPPNLKGFQVNNVNIVLFESVPRKILPCVAILLHIK